MCFSSSEFPKGFCNGHTFDTSLQQLIKLSTTSCDAFDIFSLLKYCHTRLETLALDLLSDFIQLFDLSLCNAFDIYNRPVPNSADPISVNARKTRSGVSIFILVLMLVFVLAGRYIVTNCETPIGILFGTALGVYTGYLWHSFLRACGMGQFDDIFGISNRLLSREASGSSAPKVCVPVKEKD